MAFKAKVSRIPQSPDAPPMAVPMVVLLPLRRVKGGAHCQHPFLAVGVVGRLLFLFPFLPFLNHYWSRKSPQSCLPCNPGLPARSHAVGGEYSFSFGETSGLKPPHSCWALAHFARRVWHLGLVSLRRFLEAFGGYIYTYTCIFIYELDQVYGGSALGIGPVPGLFAITSCYYSIGSGAEVVG